MSNTSQVDLDTAIRLLGKRQYWQQDEDTDISNLEQVRRDFEEQFPHFKSAPYMEAILAPGECLYLPVGWWHYIRSLTPSFSVSFWFN
jgi:ribosomal protein L16 Arg81 hydroxylase